MNPLRYFYVIFHVAKNGVLGVVLRRKACINGYSVLEIKIFERKFNFVKTSEYYFFKRQVLLLKIYANNFFCFTFIFYLEDVFSYGMVLYTIFTGRRPFSIFLDLKQNERFYEEFEEVF